MNLYFIGTTTDFRTSEKDSIWYTKKYTTMGIKDLERVLTKVLYIYDRFFLVTFEW